MTRTLFSIIGLVFFCAPAGAQVTYTLVTTGLNSVTFENGPSGLEVGDIDGDGDLDIVTIGDHGSPNINASEAGIMVWKNNGSGTSWSMVKSGTFGYGDVALGDVNGDGKMDVGYGMHHNYTSSGDFGDQVLEVAIGNGTGASWTPYDDSLAVQGQNWGMFGVDFGDLDNDGLLDIGSNGFGCCDGIWLYKNLGNGAWEVLDGNLGGNSNHMFKMGDFNNDGHIDCATANEWGQVWKNKGDGTITYLQNGIPSDAFMTFDIADVNNDGAKDIAIESSSGVKVYTYNKTTASWQSISTGLPTTGVQGIELADMDKDGKCDLINWTTTGIIIYKGDGTGNWSPADTIPIQLSQYNLSSTATGDFNNDGYTDLVYLGKTTGKNLLKVYLSVAPSVALDLLPVFPKGYECFVAGSVQFIHWLSSVPAGPGATVTIEFSSSGAAGPWSTVVNNAPNAGVHQWTVPQASSSTCFLRYTITQGANSQVIVTSNPFGIGSCATPPPTAIAEGPSAASDLVVFPNPVRETGFIQFTLDQSLPVEIKILDVLGREVAAILKEELQSGPQRIKFSAAELEAGIYLAEVGAGNARLQARLIITH